MSSNTIYIPTGVELDPSKVQGAGQGVSAVCGAQTTTNIDLALSDDMILTGLHLLSFGSSSGDYIGLSVLVSGVTVAAPVTTWYLAQNSDNDFLLNIPIKLIAGMTLRAIVTTTGLLTTPRVAINYKLWKILV